MNKVELADDETTLRVWTSDVDAVYRLLGEAEDDGLRLAVETERSIFARRVTIRLVDAQPSRVAHLATARLRSLAHRAVCAGTRSAA